MLRRADPLQGGYKMNMLRLKTRLSDPDDFTTKEKALHEAFQRGEFLLPVKYYLPEILSILSPGNNWRNIASFLGCWVDFRVDYYHPDIIKALIALLAHEEDMAFLAAAHALVALNNPLQVVIPTAGLPANRQQALASIIERSQKG